MIHGSLRLVAATFLVAVAAGSAAAAPGLTCRSIAANGGWQSTGVTLAEGDTVCVAARGFWSHGPEAGNITPWHGPAGYLFKQDLASPPIVPFPFAKIGALLGKIGDTGLAFPIDDGLCLVATPTDGGGLPGDLQLAMNDLPASFDDNQGALRVAIAIAVGEPAFNRRSVADGLAHLITRGYCLR